jgi:hypothetical protein
MIVESNGINRIFNNNVEIFDNKYNPIIRIWYYIFCFINITNILLFMLNIHQIIEILIFLPFFHIFITYIFWLIKWLKIRPNGDYQYIKTYYPDLAKTLNIDGRNTIAWINFWNGDYIDHEKDLIIDNIRERTEESSKLAIFPFKLCIICVIISIILILVKNI